MLGNLFPRLDMKESRFVYHISALSYQNSYQVLSKKVFWKKHSYFFKGSLSWNLSFAHETS